MNLKYLFYILTLFLLVSGCSSIAPLGIYTTAIPGTLSFANQTITFLEGNKFEYFSFSDNLNARKRGKGSYEIEGDQLILSFEDYNPPGSEIITTSVFATSKLVTVELTIVGVNRDPVVGATVMVKNKANEMISYCFSDASGKCSMEWALNAAKLDLSVSYTGYKDIVLAMDAISSSSFNVQMEEICQYYKNGETLSYAMKSRKYKLVLKGDNGVQVFHKRIRTK